MTTSSTGERDIAQYRAFYDCPDWCVRTDHDADVVDVKDQPVHYGPDLPGVGICYQDGEFELSVYVGKDSASFSKDLEELRCLAADLLKAVAWVEAHQ